ncbi:hypothetical protein MBEHAL_2171 [Halarchaeum acidiphilum MH1-52-1]|uniref:Uncharacterized protein n=1 Tax=Halarchaeum acidiphilum MH1-52-1 TaxID=1261545 RepID=U2YGJ7_9EURY|nr:hypothetical protein MBEHAL_2171 [Halarchaeum acidiphilum MH1-52-1]
MAIDESPRLVQRAERCEEPRELVVTPVRAHRRTLQRALRAASRPQSAFRFARPIDVARRLAGAANERTETLDRIDRLHFVERVLADARESGAEWASDLAVVVGARPSERVERVEQVRAEVETVTGWHPRRLESMRACGSGLDAPDDRAAAALVSAAVELHAALRERADGDDAVSTASVIRAATRTLAAHGDRGWRESHPSIERVTLAGVSTLSATLADFLLTLGAETSVDVHLHLRHATGERIASRLAAHASIEDPGAEVFES